MNSVSRFYEFDSFRVDTSKRLLLRNQEPVPLTSKVFDTLLMLVQNKGKLLEKEEMMKKLWPDSFVEEGNLSVNISMLRKALEETPNDHRYIVTVPGRGYKFIADVREDLGQGASLILREENVAEIQIEEVENGNAIGVTGPQQQPFRFPSSLRMIVVALILALAAFIFLRRNPEPPRSSSDPAAANTPSVKSIAVLPFRPLTPYQEDSYLGLGMADTLITKLSGIRQLIVRPTSAIQKYSTSPLDSLSVGREQRVDAVLEGSIERSQDSIRITVRLMDVRDGSSIWGYQCDEKQCSNIFEFQDLLSEKIADALLLNLTNAQRQGLHKHYTDNPDAFEAYVKGRYYWNKRTSEGLLKAIDYFTKAVKLDPQYPLPYIGLSDCYALGVWYIPIPASEAIPKLEETAKKAMELDPELGEAHLAKASFNSFMWQWKIGKEETAKAVQLSPGYPTAHHWYALCLATSGYPIEAIPQAKIARELDPLSLVINTDLGWVYYLARRYDDAIEQYKKTLELDRDFSLTHFDLAFAYSAKGMNEQAIAEMLKASDRGSDYYGGLGYIYGVAGKKTEALKALKDLTELSKTKYVPPFHFAWIYVGLGEKDQAIAYLQKVYAEHTQHVVDFKMHPMFDPLRSDPRFIKLIQQVGL
jgi:DNA-binding winged helix-turn-helix (wHTH) protein/TolB-like protein